MFQADSKIAPANLVNLSINAWYNSHQNAKQSDIDKFTRLYNEFQQPIGPFTTVVNEKVSYVGCAISYYESNGMKSLITCNYAAGNVLGQATYKSGKTASECKNKSNPRYPGLCHFSDGL